MIEQDSRDNGPDHKESSHRTLGHKVALVTHTDVQGRVRTKVWLSDFHGMEGSELIADVDMETGKIG